MKLFESYLKTLNEIRAENVVQFCRDFQCPRKRLKCLLRLRMDGHCKYDIECQKSVDREIEFLYGSFENRGQKMIDPMIDIDEYPALPDWMPDERPNG